ncbi:hypothetical protein ABIE59_000365 [Marinobacter sp. MBR-99]|jgi:hypothetical protein|uniref:PEGA domain-containing protein n=1 Tax=Marinobacter sp. MBR-99 TaxID=3156461 RepID=UPI00339611FE
MVDFRPLLFVNALALMLLVTAGFASVRKDVPEVIVPNVAETIVAAAEPVLAPEPSQEPAATESRQPEQPVADTASATPFTLPPMPEKPEMVAMAEPVSAISTRLDTPQAERPVQQPAPEQAKKPLPPSTGKLVLRSNVVGDQVTINGKTYGATRLDLELEPGRYDVTIEKPGYQPWTNTVALTAGQELTLVGRLEAYTTVNYRNGEWVGDVRTGDGTWQDDSGLSYEGHFVDGKFHGTGKAWYPDGSRYEGDWNNGERHGEGQWRSADGSAYTGQFERDQFHGKGTLTLNNGDILTGNWSRGRMDGHGSLTTADGMLYVGGFRNDEFHGQGALTYPDGRSYEGEFSNGEFHGKGSEVFADGKKYDGQYMEGRFHGRGMLRNPNGSSIEATFRHGEPYGQVRLTTAAGEIFTARTTEPGVCYRDKSYRATQCPQLEGW